MNINKFLKVLGTTLVVTCSMSSTLSAEVIKEGLENVELEQFKQISFEEGELHAVIEGSNDAGGEAKVEYVKDNKIDGTQGIKVTYGVGNWPGVKLTPAEGEKNWDLSEGGKILAFDVHNPSDVDQGLYVKLDTAVEGQGNGSIYRTNVPANSTATVYVSSSSVAPELGMQTLPPMGGNGIIAAKSWDEKPGEFDITNIDMITFWIMNNPVECEFIFDNVRMVEDPNQNYKESYKNMVDQYGQYTKQEWPDKIKSDEQLLKSQEDEDKLLDEMIKENEKLDNRTIYGGYKNEELKQEAKGYFYTAKINDKWTLIDPLGYPYFATGVDILRTADMNTWVSGREFMFESLPDKTKGFEEHYSTVAGTVKPPFGAEEGEAVNFYTSNLEKKYGDTWQESWVDHAIKRFKAWGMTSIGCWSDPELFYGKDTGNQMTYTAHAWSHEGGEFNTLYQGSPDAFDPAFEAAINKSIETTANQGTKDDPFCMGIYVDNEIHWGDATNNVDPYDVVYAAFKQEAATSPAKTKFIEMMKTKYVTVDKLNAAWGTTFKTFEDLNPSYEGKIADEDKSAMLFAIADKYYATVAAAVDKHMPNTLYLGSRIAVWGTGNEIVDAASKYVDVMSFNCYKTDVNQEWMDFGRYDKPIIIGEFHFTATDEGFFAPGLVPVGNVANRGTAYENYMNSALKQGNFVGVHWFQYYDQPVLGRAWDGENTNTGFVDVTDTPYPELVASARKVNQEMYDLKFSHNPIKSIAIAEETVELTKDNAVKQMAVTVAPENATDKTVTWKSSNPEIATVDANGVVTAVGIGSAEITVTSNETSLVLDKCKVNVTSINGEKVEPTLPTISFEKDEKAIYKVTGAKASSEIVTSQGVADGKNAIKVTMGEKSKDWGTITKLSLNAQDVWEVGTDKTMKVTVTNPNSFQIQLRINVLDKLGNIRTLYYGLPAGKTQDIVIKADEFGVPGTETQKWEDNGFYGKGVNTSQITGIEFYMPEPDDAVMGTIKTASFIVDAIAPVINE